MLASWSQLHVCVVHYVVNVAGGRSTLLLNSAFVAKHSSTKFIPQTNCFVHDSQSVYKTELIGNERRMLGLVCC